ncbi:hypothetical protein ES705_10813 [subsurface metagenome]
MEFSILKSILKPKVLSSFVDTWKPGKSPIEKYLPYKTIPALTYEIVLSAFSRPMADVTAYDTSYPRKGRPKLDKISGQIPAIRVEKQMSETDLNSFLQFSAMSDPDTEAVISLVFGDIIYCYEACKNRLSWLGFQALSKGVISLTALNNVGIRTETDIDFQVTNKSGASVKWDAEDTDTTKPITDIIALCDLARLSGVIFKKILMSRTSFSYMRKSAETINFCFGASGSAVTKYPNLSVINENLVADGLPAIDLIDVYLQFENEDHDITNLQAWNEGTICFLPQDEVGWVLNSKTAEEAFPPKQVLQEKKDIVLISKWSDVAPIREYCAGAVNAFPALKLSHQIFMINSLATSWAG